MKELKAAIVKFNGVPHVEDGLPRLISYAELLKPECAVFTGTEPNSIPESVKSQMKEIQERITRAKEEIELVKTDMKCVINAKFQLLLKLQRIFSQEADLSLKSYLITLCVDCEQTLKILLEECHAFVGHKSVSTTFTDLVEESSQAAAFRTLHTRLSEDLPPDGSDSSDDEESNCDSETDSEVE